MKSSCIIIVSVLLLTTFVSCCGTGQAEIDKETSVVTNAVNEETVVDYDPKLEAVDYNGETFTFLTRPTDGYCRQLDDITAESEDGTHLNDAIFKRNSKIMDKYNLTFEIIAKNADVTSEVRKTVNAGDDAYDIVLNGINENVKLSSEGLCLELSSLPHVDLTKPYWSRDILEDMSIYDHYYVGISDLTIQAYFSSGIVYFNKQLAKDYNLGNVYDLVYDGSWTFDKMAELCRNVSADLNGDSVFDEKDQYGITFNNFAWQILYYGGGETFVAKNDDGSLYFNGNSERIVNFLQKLMPFSQDSEAVLYSENYRHLGGNYRIDVCQNAFNEGRSLFWLEAMYGVPTLREMEMDFGILPVPKFDESQENYASFVHTAHGSSLIVPITVSNTDMVGRVLEDLTYASADVRAAFIDTTLKGKYARDNDSADMIDLIINNIRTDYALLLNTSGLTLDSDLRSAMDKGSTDIGSLFASKLEPYQTALDKYNQVMSELDT